MILTGQAKKDFEKWYSSTDSVNIYKSDYSEEVFKAIQNALIIEWFDSIGFYTEPRKYVKGWGFDIFGKVKFIHETELSVSRQYALSKAIEKVNEIYNCNF